MSPGPSTPSSFFTIARICTMSERVAYGDDPDHASYYFGNYDAVHGTIKLSDELISAARPFDGWHPEFLRWDRRLWKEPGRVPCPDPEKNAYHVRYLAESMLEAGGWIARYDPASPDCHHAGALVIEYGKRVVRSGSHRLRAWRYLLTTRRIMFDVPLAC